MRTGEVPEATPDDVVDGREGRLEHEGGQPAVRRPFEDGRGRPEGVAHDHDRPAGRARGDLVDDRAQVVLLTPAHGRELASARATGAGVIEHEIETGLVQVRRVIEHLGSRAPEAMDEDDAAAWSGGRDPPGGEPDAVSTSQLDRIEWQAEVCRGASERPSYGHDQRTRRQPGQSEPDERRRTEPDDGRRQDAPHARATREVTG